MPTSKVRALRDRKAELPEAANGRIKALRQVFKYAIAAEHPGAERNPARDVPYMKTGSQGFHTWTIDEVLQYAKKHPIGTKAYLALALLLFTGQRRSDVVSIWPTTHQEWLAYVHAGEKPEDQACNPVDPDHALVANCN
jgi:site-specific recombinase XerD